MKKQLVNYIKKRIKESIFKIEDSYSATYCYKKKYDFQRVCKKVILITFTCKCYCSLIYSLA